MRKRESLQLESYAKARALADPKIYRRDEEMVREYGQRLKQIEKEISVLDSEIVSLESQIL
jgi:cyanate lyase